MDTIPESLTCSICLDYFDDPRVIKCGHTFCLKCLRAVGTPPKITCALCRQESTQLREDTPKNYTLCHVIEDLNQKKLSLAKITSSSSSSPPICTKHNEPMKLFCYDCRCVICSMCFPLEHQTHKIFSIPDAVEKMRLEIFNLNNTLYEASITVSKQTTHDESEISFAMTHLLNSYQVLLQLMTRMVILLSRMITMTY